MFYDKKIKYLDYYESGSRIRGAGYVKLEARGQSLRMELAITNLHPTDSFDREVFLCAGTEEKSLDIIRLSGGRGQYLGQWSDSTNIGGIGIDYAGLTGIHIPLGSGREISCNWQSRQISSTQSAPPKREETMPLKVSPMETEKITLSKTSPKEAEKIIPIAEITNRKKPETEIQGLEHSISREPYPVEASTPTEIRAASEQISKKEAETQREIHSNPPTVPQKLLEDKWEQLWSIYPHLRPFQDEREYLSIKPADFVVFSASSYRMSNNSFLLHGYYNYKHLIVARIEKRGEIRYYIGVPGNYFEKEKQVAIMFGFESFECAEEPAQAGDFGYYMMRIEI